MIKKILIVFLFAVSAATVQAKIDGDDIAKVVIGIILGKMYEKNKHKKDDNIVWDNSDKVILKHSGDQLILANLVLQPRGSSDSVTLPRCKVSKNEPVYAVRFRVDQSDVYVRSVALTYQNGSSETVSVNRNFRKGASSSWYELSGQGRCVQKSVLRVSLWVRAVKTGKHAILC